MSVMRIFHCRQRTAKGQYCWNHLRQAEGLRVKKSGVPEAGMGLFAERGFREGEVIAQYSGDRVAVADGRGNYLLQLTNASCVDAARTNSGMGRWANDPRSSGTGANARFVVNRSARTACLKATRHITKGEEVFVPYGAAYWNQFARLKQAKADAARERHPDQPDRLAAMLTEGLDVLRALRSAAAADESYAKLVAGPRAAGDQRVERDGLLLYKSRICVPEDQALRTRIVGELHDTPLGGHLGRDK